MKNPSIAAMPTIIGKPGSSKASWYSPGVDSLGTEHCDLSLMRHCYSRVVLSKACNAWLGGLVKGQHSLLVPSRVDRVVGQWYFALGEVSQTCSLVWPAEEEVLPGASGVAYRFDRSCRDVNDVLFAVVDLDSVQALSFSWVSPFSLMQQVSDASELDMRGAEILAVPFGEVGGLLQVAAEAAFWSLPECFLTRLSKHLGLATPVKGDLFSLLWNLCKFSLDRTDAEIMKVLERRLAAHQGSCERELLQIDEALEVMERDDRDECVAAQQKVLGDQTQRVAFQKAWTTKRALVLASSASSAGIRKEKRRKAELVQRLAIPAGALEQQSLRPLVPPSGHLWRNTASGGWEAHFKPYKRVSFSGACHVHRMAAIHCLRHLWECWMTVHGKSKADVPIIDLWSDEGAESALSAASSSQAVKGTT